MVKNNVTEVKDFTEEKSASTHLGRARTKEQFLEMRKDEEAGVCPFCRILEEEKKWIIEGHYWCLKFNDYPYKNHQHHSVIIFKEHTEDFVGISEEIWQELGKMLLAAKSMFNLPAINLVMRFGDPALRSSTIHHLHGHIQVPSEEIVARNATRTIEDLFTGSQILQTPSSWLYTKKNLTLEDSLGWKSIKDPNEDPFQFQKIFVTPQSPAFFIEIERYFKTLFPDLMKHCQVVMERLSIQGGGFVFRMGSPDFTNGKFGVFPYGTIYCPNGKGRVQATLVPALPEDKKAPCKATFCKGFEGEELKKLEKRMKIFNSP